MKCVLLLNLGGPDRLEAVEPFLANLFSDPNIISFPLGPFRFPLAHGIARLRSKKVRELYKKIGGRSPLREITSQQAASLEKKLGPGYRVGVAMRYWHPDVRDAVEGALRSSPESLVLLPLYPQYSTATTGSSFREFERVWDEFVKENKSLAAVSIRLISHFYNDPGFLGAMAELILQAEKEVPGPGAGPVHLVFSAHGLPERVIERGDPYQGQVEKTVEGVVARLGGREHVHLCYQSRVGPLKWIGPSTEEALEELARKGVRRILMIPISFVSDHLETLYEIDILFRNRALDLGISHFHRVPALNTSEKFIEALKNIILSLR